MARSPRIDYPGAVHHIMNRGARKAPLFATTQARRVFVKRLSTLPARFNIQIQAWVLMPNHYHLLIRSPTGDTSVAMKWLGQTITQHLNTVPSWDGPVFRGRYRNRVVTSERHHAHLFAYLHLNPVPTLAAQAHRWPWSSARVLHGLQHAPEWLDTVGMKACFGSSDALADYTQAVREGRQEAPETFDASVLWEGQVTGTAERITPSAITTCIDRLLEHPTDAPRTELEAAALVRLSGLSQRQAAVQLGVSRSSVARAVGRFATALEPGEALRRRFDAMLMEQWSCQEMAG